MVAQLCESTKITQLWIVWYVNYISIKLIKKGKVRSTYRELKMILEWLCDTCLSNVIITVVVLFLFFLPAFLFHSFIHLQIFIEHPFCIRHYVKCCLYSCKEYTCRLCSHGAYSLLGKRDIKYLHKYMSDYILYSEIWGKRLGCCRRCRGDMIQICDLLRAPYKVMLKLNSEG